ncbi:DUF6804 family protein [Zobellia alginiliquefaciens]|uniref:DUF6804 family protein n=1 Tax=Zobellia alginiliquefaciens TaxID=3032586 RepID=UPI003D7ACB02
MKYNFKRDFYSYLALASAFILTLAIFPLDSFYYKFLRVFVCISAFIISSQFTKNPSTLLSFILIAYLFNPIFPIYLFQKFIWIPIDIICALVFLASAFKIKNTKPFIPYARKKAAKSYGRDRKF